MCPQFVAPIAVEGDPDEALLERLIEHVGGEIDKVHGKEGDSYIRENIEAYNEAARQWTWCVLVDLDHKFDCAPALCEAWLPGGTAPGMCFRVAVREIEAWLMADEQGLASFLDVSADHIPQDVEAVDYPKRKMVAIARQSSNRDIREDMVPRKESGREVGPAYNSRLVEFASDYWRPEVAADRSDSLNRAIECLQALEPPM